jgi:multisubunit Na+/H+ antiporter MnhG subunit
MEFSKNVDEISAFIMVVAGVAVLAIGCYALFILEREIAIETLIAIASTLLGPSTGYLFGKSVPKKEKS